jgi:hypothetical protein
MGGAYSLSKGLAVSQKTDTWKPDPQNVRSDGSIKGEGWLGPLKRLDNPNDVSSEISIGVDWGKGEKLIPTMVPNLNKSELEYLLSTPEEELDSNPEMFAQIRKKAARHAMDREQKGLPYFAREGEQQKFPNLKAINDDSFVNRIKRRAGLD